MIGPIGEILDAGGDGGDSCNFTCTAIALGMYDTQPATKVVLINLFWNEGQPVRHPHQTKRMTIEVGEIKQTRIWLHHNNAKNFSRDQAIPLIEVLSQSRAERFLQSLKDNHWFLPNSERDIEGSIKRPYPHFFVNDRWELEFSWFDHADFATPDFIGFVMIKAGVAEKHPWFMRLAKWWCKRSIDAYAKVGSVDFKQLYFTARAYGLVGYMASKYGLRAHSHQYFVVERDLPELHQAFLREFDRQGF